MDKINQNRHRKEGREGIEEGWWVISSFLLTSVFLFIYLFIYFILFYFNINQNKKKK